MSEELSAHTADLKILQNDSRTIPQSLSRQPPLHKGAFLCGGYATPAQGSLSIFLCYTGAPFTGEILFVEVNVQFPLLQELIKFVHFTPYGIQFDNIPLPS